jgi:erythromycin esterase-like protein
MRILRLLPLLLFLGPLPLGAQDSAAEAARGPAGYPVQPGIWRLHGTAPGLPQDDLAPLQQIVGKATVVGLGESFHTSGGYYEAKHRLFRYLVEKMGFRVLAIESSWLDADRVAQYVETCAGSAEEALTEGLFPVWASVETRELVQWMCQWNRSHRNPKDRVHFYGFDIQFQQKEDGEALIGFLKRIGLAEDDPRILGINRCEGVVETFFPDPLPEDRYQDCKAALAAVARLFEREAASIVRRTSKRDFGWAKVRQVGLDTFMDQLYYRETAPERAFDARDRGMAYIFQAIRNLRYPGAKTALWAHNHHLAKNSPEYFYSLILGTLLDRSLKKGSYVSIALIGREVSIDWPAFNYCGPRPAPGNGAVEWLLHDLGEDFLLVDLDSPFLEEGKVYEFSDYPMVPRRQFDALVFLDVSPKFDPLDRPACR